MEGIPPTPRKPRSEGRQHKKAKSERIAKQEQKHESNQLPVKAETMLQLDPERAETQQGYATGATKAAEVKVERSIKLEPIVKNETLIEDEPSIKDEPMEDFDGNGRSTFSAPQSGHVFMSQEDGSSTSTACAKINGNHAIAVSAERAEQRSDLQPSHVMHGFVKVEPAYDS